MLERLLEKKVRQRAGWFLYCCAPPGAPFLRSRVLRRNNLAGVVGADLVSKLVSILRRQRRQALLQPGEGTLLDGRLFPTQVCRSWMVFPGAEGASDMLAGWLIEVIFLVAPAAAGAFRAPR